MSLERKPLYLTLDSTKQFELPNTASAVGIDLNTGKQIYFNTGSGNWERVTNISSSQGSFQYVQLLPVEAVIIPTNITASYIYASGSTNDIFFTQYSGTGTENTTRLRWLESGLTTGLLYGGVISATNGSTSFNVSSGSGIIVDYNGSLTRDIYTTTKIVSWGNQTNQSLIYSGSAQITYVAIDAAGTVVQQNVPFTEAQYIDYIQIGRVLHQTGSVVNGTITSPSVAYGLNAWNSSFNRAIGPLKISGHLLAASGSTLSLTKTAGSSYVEGRNYLTDPSSPNLILPATDTALTVSKIFYEYVNSLGISVIDSGIGNSGYTVIDKSRYNLNGVLTPTTPNKVTIQRVYWFPNSNNRALFIYYGSAQYDTLNDAQVAIPTEIFTEGENTLGAAILVAYILVDSNCTSLADPTKARIVQAGQTRGSGGGGGTGLVTPPGGLTTQVQYNNDGVFGGDSGLTYNSSTKILTTTASLALRTPQFTDGGNKVNTTGSFSFAGNLGSNYYASDVGADVFLFISGSSGSRGTSTRGVTVFGGDVVISGTLAGGSPLEVATEMLFLKAATFTAPTLFSNQVSGSIFNTVDGLPYLTSSNSNLVIHQNHATKQLEITSSAGGSNTQIQYNNNGLFGGVPSITYNGSTLQATGSFSGTFSGSLTGSLTIINGSTPYLVGSGAVSLSTGSNGQVKILVSEDNGTWTPAFTFGTVNGTHTYSSQVGRYYKIGRQVTANFAISLSSLGTSTGDVSLVNLPFTSESGVDGSGAGSVIVFKNIAGGVNRIVSLGAYIGANTTSASLYHASTATSNATTLTDTNLTATTQLTGSVTYISAT
jgi:hypothetical protein